jgi:hypothetical protein
MGWNDRNPELYESITGLRYEDDKPIGSPRGTMPSGWVPPAMPDTCSACKYEGDMVNDPIYEGECAECDEPCCINCAHEHDADEGGVMLWCSAKCYDEA